MIHRSDSSGTTNIFTGYLTAVSQTWADEVGKGKEVKWPVGLGGQGNDGVTAVIKQQSGSIGYVELSYAIESDLPVADPEEQGGQLRAAHAGIHLGRRGGSDVPRRPALLAQ